MIKGGVYKKRKVDKERDLDKVSRNKERNKKNT